jgi:hypothetical protein
MAAAEWWAGNKGRPLHEDGLARPGLIALHRYGMRVSTPDPAEPYEVIHLGGEAAAIVPLAELRRLRAVERRASPEMLEEADIEAALAHHREWVAAGRPGAVSHEEAMAELLGGDQR